ncbi:MAG: putative ABC transporter permease [Ruthenibacterium sp.]
MNNIFFAGAYEPYDVVNAFFLYSFMGWIMESIVIRVEKGHWEKRGFVHGPFCIIYGFGAMFGYVLLKPFSFNYVVLYFAGALLATLLEYLTARLMLRIFGTFWWDYNAKPFNYHGMLCLESTLVWGVIALLLFTVLQRAVLWVVTRLPAGLGTALSFLLVCGYVVDFICSVRKARRADKQQDEVPSSMLKE